MDDAGEPAQPAKIPLTWEERRLKRQIRRDKQRLANVDRAIKMHRLRISRQTCGKDVAETPLQGDKKPQYFIGCSGWFYWKWREIFYPAQLPTREWFKYYASRFDTVEINASFYSWPTPAGVKAWVRAAGRRKFVFTVKVCELITHVKQFIDTDTLVLDFGVIGDLLGARMGCFLFQLPPSFKYSPERLDAILGQLDRRRRNVVEFRHASWWNENVFAAFRQTGTIFCSCSAPKLPDVLIKTADDIYVRFHGKDRWYRHDYTKAELFEWKQRIETSGAKRVWVYFNNDYEAYATKNARQLARMLKQTK
jgi:uncharacterized protein YecE (DUF72 family)